MSVRSKLTKSPQAVLDATTQQALDSVLQTLEKQADHVVSVDVLSNFSLDQEAALVHNVPFVTQGIVVCLDKGYRMGPEDISWFHPSIGAGRSVFELKTSIAKRDLNKIEELQESRVETGAHLSAHNCSVGEYASAHPDEFGCEHIKKHLVVDTSSDALLAPLHASWLAEHLTAGDIDKRWKRTKFGDTVSVTNQTSKMRKTIARKISKKATLTHEDTFNNVLSDTKHVYFLNGAIKTSNTDKDILVKTSALGGYSMYTALKKEQTFYPASMGSANSFYSWEKMSPANCARIENTCIWNGTFNTQIMRPPSVRTPREVETSYHMLLKHKMNMRIARFSNTSAIHDRLKPSDILGLTPTEEQLSSAHNYLTAPITLDHPTTRALMERVEEITQAFPTFHIFNPEIVENSRLKVPREVFKHLLK